MCMIKNEIGNKYGPWVVVDRFEPNYRRQDYSMVRWKCKCVHCSAQKIYIGNTLRFNHYGHTCKRCGGQ